MTKKIILTNNKNIGTIKSKFREVFESLDIQESSVIDYQRKIELFLTFVNRHGFSCNTFLNFKRMLAKKTNLTINTKNKYLTTARVFLRELNRRGVVPF
jgi:integrase/recombinase XerC